jgi:hypothetical protein
MAKFSQVSKERLATCDHRLQELMNDVIQHVDISILCGYRGKEDQDKACAAGNSKAPFPTSRHNCSPSQAVDVAPFPIDWNDLKRFKELGALVKERAAVLGIPIEWGGDWKKFVDLPHYQLKEEKNE